MLAIGLFGRPVNEISTWKPTEWLSRYLDMVPSYEGAEELVGPSRQRLV